MEVTINFFIKLLIINHFIIIYNTQIIVQANYNSIDTHSLYCDDQINFYGTSNLNVYKIIDEENKININSQLIMNIYDGPNPLHHLCTKNIHFKTTSNNEKILLEFNNPNNLLGLFKNSSAIYIEIKSGNFDNYQDFSFFFSYSLYLKSINITKFNFKNAKSINAIFHYCSNLEEIIWPTNMNSPLLISAQAVFYGCSKLISIDISNFNFSNVIIMFGFFADCLNLEKIIFPKNISSIEDVSGMFYNCKKLTSIDLSNFEFSNIYNMTNLFNGCINLTKIIWPEKILI